MKRVVIIFITIIPVLLSGQTWDRMLEAWVDDVYKAGAYSGGVNYSRPFWVDIDADNDFDLFIGSEQGSLHFYRNDGSTSSPSWTFIVEHFYDIDVGNRSSEAFCDIDGDGDYDLFIGEQWGELVYYQNEGTASADSFVFITASYGGIDVGRYSAPFFCDIDNDNDYDLFIGEHSGNLNYYRNDGTSTSPSWTLVAESWFGIDVGTKNIPWFADIDADGDFDLFIGYSEGTTYFYRNDGTTTTPDMVYVTNNYVSDVGNTNAPSFVDIDNDGDYDFFVGEYIGNINWYRNTGTPWNASWSFIQRHYLTIDMNSSTTPALVDIDADGDLDLFSGEWVGFIDYFENTGTATNHRWTIVSENYEGIDVGDNSAPTVIDIDNDNDYDLFIGNLEGMIYYYRNDGSSVTPNFNFVTNSYNGIDIGDRCAPTFIDIDGDNDYDLFIGDLIGTIWHYRNDGTVTSPSWTYVTDNYSGIDVGDQSVPVFEDIDIDGDYDLFIGEALGHIHYYQNIGTPSTPSFTLVTNNYANIDVDENTAPYFANIDNDGDNDLFIGERWGGLNLWERDVPDIIPPNAPYVYAEKAPSGSDLIVTWNKITTDTLGNPESMDHYVVYRNIDPAFIPGNPDSIGITVHPDTTYTDVGVLPATESYYYLVKAVDHADNKSIKSNMGYKFNKFINENTGNTGDRNWSGVPWHNEYPNVSDVTSDLSPVGEAILKITNLKDDQIFESWIYHPVVGWYGSDFTISSGRAYELLGAKDTILIFAGSNNPDGCVILNENTGAVGDRNWTSIPYNADYDSIRDITDEYSTSGEAILKITNLKDDQIFESWIYHPVIGWYGSNFAIERGRGYEFLAAVDTIWNPTEFSNRSVKIPKKYAVNTDIDFALGTLSEPNRQPSWIYVVPNNETLDLMNPNLYLPVRGSEIAPKISRNAGTSHIVRCEIEIQKDAVVTLTAYRPDKPYDVITENTIGSCIARKGKLYVMSFDAGNFKQSWINREQIILLISATSDDQHRYHASKIILDQGINIQDLGLLELERLPRPQIDVEHGSCTWEPTTNPLVIGYSVTKEEQRLNNSIIIQNHWETDDHISVHPVFAGGFEIVIGQSDNKSGPSTLGPNNFSIRIYPNPYCIQTSVNYTVPYTSRVTINIYDVSGRHVKTLVSEVKDSGYYTTFWQGKDDHGHSMANGIYFVRMHTKEYQSQQKIIFLK